MKKEKKNRKRKRKRKTVCVYNYLKTGVKTKVWTHTEFKRPLFTKDKSTLKSFCFNFGQYIILIMATYAYVVVIYVCQSRHCEGRFESYSIISYLRIVSNIPMENIPIIPYSQRWNKLSIWLMYLLYIRHPLNAFYTHESELHALR